jgi:hypothetical protein
MAVSDDKYKWRVQFVYPKLWYIINWAGLIGGLAFSVFGAFIWYTVTGHLGNGLESAIKYGAHDMDMDDEEWFVRMMLLASPLMAISMWSGFIRLRQPLGFLEAKPEGLSIACYTFGPIHLSGFGDWFTWGMTKWDNLSDVGVVKRFFILGLGLQFENLDDFLKSRRSTKSDEFLKRGRQGPNWARLTLGWLLVSPIGKFLGLLWNIQGLTSPKSVEEKDVLVWNCENFGYHIVIPGRTLPRAAQEIVNEIERLRSSTDKTTPDMQQKA